MSNIYMYSFPPTPPSTYIISLNVNEYRQALRLLHSPLYLSVSNNFIKSFRNDGLQVVNIFFFSFCFLEEKKNIQLAALIFWYAMQAQKVYYFNSKTSNDIVYILALVTLLWTYFHRCVTRAQLSLSPSPCVCTSISQVTPFPCGILYFTRSSAF